MPPTVISACTHPDSCHLVLFWSCKCPIGKTHTIDSTGGKLIDSQEDYLTDALVPLTGQVGNIWRVIELCIQRLVQNDTYVAPLTNQGTIHLFPLIKGLRCNPAATGHRIQIYVKHPAERWRHECRHEQEDTVWMEQLEEDVRRPMRQEVTNTRYGK